MNTNVQPCGDPTHNVQLNLFVQASDREQCRVAKIVLMRGNGSPYTVHALWATRKPDDAQAKRPSIGDKIAYLQKVPDSVPRVEETSAKEKENPEQKTAVKQEPERFAGSENDWILISDFDLNGKDLESGEPAPKKRTFFGLGFW